MRATPRTTVLAAITSALLLVGCSDDADDPVGFDADTPEFADDGDVDRGDVAERPAEAISANLAVDGEAIDLTGAVCVASDVDVPGGFGFQAALAERDGSVSASIDPDSGDAEIELFLDGEVVPTSGATASAVGGVWQVRTTGAADPGSTEGGTDDTRTDGPDTGDGATEDVGPDGVVQVPEVLLSFECPTEFQQRFRGPSGLPDVTPDPEQ